jgi:hypothetical protein
MSSATTTKGTTMKTIAQHISSLFRDDGQRLETAAGITIQEVCEIRRGRCTWKHGYRAGDCRYDFADGSAIIVAREGWDLALPGCAGFCMAGNKWCECREVAA